MNQLLVILLASLLSCPDLHAASITFTPRELFQVPFGDKKERLGAKVENGNFIIPRDFTLDAGGHVYIYDTVKHRIARYASDGAFQLDYRYLPTAQQVFAHADARENLWILVTEPAQGMFYGIYDRRGKRINAGIFSRFNRFRLHVDDDFSLRVILSSTQDPTREQSYVFDEERLLLRKKAVALPSQTHHEVLKNGQVFYVDQVPSNDAAAADQISQITDASRKPVGRIRGQVIYVTDRGEVYTRVGIRDLRVYDADGTLLSRIALTGHSSACSALRFDSLGNVYLLDGIPDHPEEKEQDLRYGPDMKGMRLLQWERS